VKEGSLEAPTRHAVDWKNEEFYDEKACIDEMERIFDICHGCRRCVSLCGSFPTLFDLIDEGESMELDSVDKSDYWKVVDQCYLCDVCYLTKCPYVPPHPWNLDFPHTMLRAKAIQFKKGTKTKIRDTLLSNTSANGKLASIPVVTQSVNFATTNKALRSVGEKMLGVHKSAWLPKFAKNTFEKNFKTSEKFPVQDGKLTKGKVAVYSTCYINWNEPGIGHDLIEILKINEIPYVVVEKQGCCGMPKLELGDLDSVEKLKNENIPKMAKLAKDGYVIVSPIPSCTLMFKQELPLLFPDDSDVQIVGKAMMDPFEYFKARMKDNLFKTDFNSGPGNVSYHVSCHLRVQNVGQKTREVLEKIPGSSVNTVERCSGHAGTWGVKKEFHETALKIGKPVFRQMNKHPNSEGGTPDVIASDCQLAAHHIRQGIGSEVGDNVKHPLTILADAYKTK
jgi:Fe-S oxidoreductase